MHIWNLVLAHLLGDYVFQTDWMVSKRDNLWVLCMHAGIHFITMVILVGQARSAVWPFLLLIAVMHLLQDRVKNNIVNVRPAWIRTAYVIDQVLHLIIIWAVVVWIQNLPGQLVTPEKPAGFVVIIAYLFATQVWYISERLFNRSNSDYLENLNNTRFPRMLSRSALISLFLLVWVWAGPKLAVVFSNPYPNTRFRQRAILTDVSISLVVMLFLFWSLR